MDDKPNIEQPKKPELPKTDPAEATAKSAAASKLNNPVGSIKEAAELLKKLSEFNSKKEEFMAKLSGISDRMQRRMNGDTSVRLEDANTDLKLRGVTPNYKPPSIEHLTSPVSDPIEKLGHIVQVKSAKIRETKSIEQVNPVTLVISTPSLMVMENGEWLSKTFAIGDDKIHNYDSCWDVTNRKFIITNGNIMTIPTCLKIGIQPGSVFAIETIDPKLMVVSSKYLTESNADEFSVSVMAIDGETTIEPDKPFVKLVSLSGIVQHEELLNSTFMSWIKGEVH